MVIDARPVVVAYDGSPAARTAVREAAGVFTGRTLVVVTVWEPGLAAMVMSPVPAAGTLPLPPDVETTVAVEDASREHAQQVATQGADLARSLGAEAEPQAVPDEANAAEVITEIAEQRDACAVVVGSRRVGGLRARLGGSTSRGVLAHCRRPVLVVHDEHHQG